MTKNLNWSDCELTLVLNNEDIFIIDNGSQGKPKKYAERVQQEAADTLPTVLLRVMGLCLPKARDLQYSVARGVLAVEEEMEDKSRQPRIFCWISRCCWSGKEEQEDEEQDYKKGEDRRRWGEPCSGQDDLVVEELKVETTCLKMSRSSSSLPHAEVWHLFNHLKI